MWSLRYLSAFYYVRFIRYLCAFYCVLLLCCCYCYLFSCRCFSFLVLFFFLLVVCLSSWNKCQPIAQPIPRTSWSMEYGDAGWVGRGSFCRNEWRMEDSMIAKRLSAKDYNTTREVTTPAISLPDRERRDSPDVGKVHTHDPRVAEPLNQSEKRSFDWLKDEQLLWVRPVVWMKLVGKSVIQDKFLEKWPTRRRKW